MMGSSRIRDATASSEFVGCVSKNVGCVDKDEVLLRWLGKYEERETG